MLTIGNVKINVSPSGYGLKCYKCASTKGWDDCADVKKELDCPSISDRCYKAYAGVKAEGVSFEGYEKGCATAALCDKVAKAMKSQCKDQAKCTIDCCSGDLCNAAALQMASAIVLITCALVALLY